VSSTGETEHPSAVVNRSGIVTPDAVGLDLQIATLGSRGAAYLLDLVIFLTVLGLLSAGQALLGAAGFVPGWFGIALLLVFAFLWQFGYPIGFEVLNRGRTPGKAALGLRVVTVEGAPVRLRHATIRATVGVLELLGTTGGIAVVSSFASERSQRLGDMAAGTLVVRERRGGGSPAVETFLAPAGLEAYAARLDVSGLRASDYATIRETLRRARELPSPVRAQLTSELAHRFMGRVQPPPPANGSAEQFLTCLAAAVQSRRASAVGAAAPGPAGWSSGPAPAPASPPAPASAPTPASAPASATPPTPEAPPERPRSGFAPPE
jgi:uncharacterized RDD family membrane protein YckC